MVNLKHNQGGISRLLPDLHIARWKDLVGLILQNSLLGETIGKKYGSNVFCSYKNAVLAPVCHIAEVHYCTHIQDYK